jgi:hypothetical protein
MPLIASEDPVLYERHSLPELDDERPRFTDVVRAAFEQENSLASLIASGSKPRPVPPGPLSPERRLGGEPWDPFTEIEGYEAFASSFVEAESRADVARIKANIDRELDNRRILEDAGALGMASQIVAGATDPLFLPLMFVPGGQILKLKPLAAGLRTAVYAGLGAGASELALHQTQETRTPMESAFNIGGSVVVSGVLGATISGLSRKQAQALAAKVDRELAEGVTDASGVVDAPRSVGAQARRATTLDEETLIASGTGIEKLPLSPLLRTANSPSVRTRQILEDLIETPLFTRKNLQGKATGPAGGAVETRVKMYDAALGVSFEQMDRLYLAYRQSGSRVALRVRDMLGARRRSGVMSFREFREEIGRALRRGDTHPVPEVERAARVFREQVFDPLKHRAIALNLLPDDVQVRTAPTYLTRVWRHDRIAQRRGEFRDILTRWFQSQDRSLSEIDARALADGTIENIMGTPAGRMPVNVVPKAGPLKDRVLLIPDELVEEFLESDIEAVARFYTRTMATDVEFTARFGEKDMRGALGEIRNDYDLLMQEAGNNARKLKALQRHLEADLRDIQAMRDRLLGTYRAPADPNDFFYRAARSVRDINYLRMLGGMTISSISDLARPVMLNGLGRTLKGLYRLTTAPRRFRMAAKEVKVAGTAWDMVLHSRAMSLAELGHEYGRYSRFERGLKGLSDSFSVATLMSPWNAALKQFTGVVVSHGVLDDATRWVAGRAGRNAIKKLALSGIDEDMARRIVTMFREFGDDAGSVKLPQAHRWTDREAAQAFRAAVVKNTDQAIVTPGVGERPLWMSTETGKMIGQFKSFAVSATHKVMLSGLQQRDMAALNGLYLSLALGAVVYGAKQTVAGREISDDPNVWMMEALDWSGLTGFLYDANNITEKLTRGHVGINAAFGGPPMSRYASRNVLGALLGPSADTVGDVSQVIGALSAGDMRQSDLRAVRKLLPYQNLFYIRQMLNAAEEGAGEALGLPD